MPTVTLSWILSMEYVAGIIFTYAVYYWYTSSRTRYPPGPKPLPFIGNILQIPTQRQEEVFAEWGAQYGDLVYLNVLGQPMMILNSLQAARDLLDKRSSIYSDRPRFVLLSEMMGWKNASTHMRYGPRFRKHRKFINQTFNQRAVSTYRPLQESATVDLIEDLVRRPDIFVDHIRRFAAATILKITYGRDVTSVDDEVVQLVERAASLTTQTPSAAANLVDFFPIMKYIPTWAPFSSFKIRAEEVKKAVDAMMEVPFQQVVDDMKSGIAVPSYTSTLLESHRDPAGSIAFEDEEDIKGSAGTLFAAAEDTTVASLHTFILAMLLHPEELKKAQEEIDQVIGPNRIPNIDDRPSLPYLECILKEVLRWNPPVPLGMPHRLMGEDFYKDFYIPSGTTVLANIYAIVRDCPEPDAFMPRRYLDDDDSLPDPHGTIFGFGRRICPGRYLAESNYWQIAAAIASCFDITKCIDEEGRDVNISYEFSHGFIRRPKPFKCDIRPRPQMKSLLENMTSGRMSAL